MITDHEHRPGDPAPSTGFYRLHNVLGAPTEALTYVREGEALAALEMDGIRLENI